MWEKTPRNLFFVEKGIAFPENDALFITPAILEDRKCYAVFHKRDLKRELALFGGDLESEYGRPELIEQGRSAVEDHGWREVRGPNGLPWFVALARKIERRDPWGVMFFGACVSDLGALGWCVFSNDGILLYSFELKHQEGVNRRLVTSNQELPLWHLALSNLWRDTKKNG